MGVWFNIAKHLRASHIGICMMLAFVTPSSAIDLSEVGIWSHNALFGKNADANIAIDALAKRGDRDALAVLIQTARVRHRHPGLLKAISTLTRTPINGWHQAMLWQEDHPEIIPHQSYVELKTKFLTRIDPRFDRFLGSGRAERDNMKVRLEEVTWGGVGVDGIPSLDNPELISGSSADYMLDDDLVFGIQINGDARAYPLRIMGWHEMFNETIGGVPVALAYCTLCGSGILFETQIEGREKPLVFGSSGLLYRSNKLMFDRETDSLWNQFTGEPVSGPLVESGIRLKIRPVTITSWKSWLTANPETKVLSLNTGYRRDYRSGSVYNAYFSSPELMFPAVVRNEETLLRKDYIFGIRDVAASKAWPLEAFTDQKLINDKIGFRNIVLLGDAASRTVRAYDRGDRTFQQDQKSLALSENGNAWTITEEFLLSDKGDKLPRIAGHISYWFAWDGYLGVRSELYSAK
ncbi:MAG: DUF3179 domain-containing protein [Cohaesibacteraceae bacterium]|nr:DUF3179 domain-containing protein [Cohaesibacteraceae bacterium]MBL4876851.1 DUF3179 domain-containing protein [Cohaesibacteraceae bacterium]